MTGPGPGPERLKVLHLTHVIPWPPDYGGTIAVWNHLRADARHARVGLVSFVEAPPTPEAVAALRNVCEIVHFVPRPRGYDGRLGRLRALVSTYPVNLARYRWPVLAETARRVSLEWRPDLVVAQHLHMAPHPLRISGPARILRPHNVDSMLVSRLGLTTPNRAMGMLFRALAAHTRWDERRFFPRFDRCLFLSEEDAHEASRSVPAARTGVLPPGIDVTEYAPAALPAPQAPPLLVTAGSFHFPPTAEGVTDFVERVWPEIHRRWPTARFRVIGMCPDAWRDRLNAYPGVEVLGSVARVAARLDGAHGFLVALKAGSGVRIKILEAFARRLPVVSTRAGAEGLGATAGLHYLEADEPGEFLNALSRLFTETELGPRLREAGREFVETDRSLEAMARASERVYREVLGESTEKRR